MAKKKSSLSPFLLAAAAAVLMTGGWLMASFPLLIFFGLTPLFALAEPTGETDSIFEKMELVLLSLGTAFITHAIVQQTSVVVAIVVAIAFTLAFVAHAYVRQVLGVRTGKITLILFWLAIEYLALKFSPSRALFLADALAHTPEWTRWSVYTGYLGATLWILAVNACFYFSLLQEGSLRGGWLVAGIVMLAGPILYSYLLKEPPITREIMVNLYGNMLREGDVTYLARGEWVVRTASWISTLILLFTFVKHQTRK